MTSWWAATRVALWVKAIRLGPACGFNHFGAWTKRPRRSLPFIKRVFRQRRRICSGPDPNREEFNAGSVAGDASGSCFPQFPGRSESCAAVIPTSIVNSSDKILRDRISRRQFAAVCVNRMNGALGRCDACHGCDIQARRLAVKGHWHRQSFSLDSPQSRRS